MRLETLWDRQMGRCFYCACKAMLRSRPLDKPSRVFRMILSNPYRRATREHLIRKCDGGKDEGNLVLACAYCNSSRGERSVEDHRWFILSLINAGGHPNISAKKYRQVSRKYGAYLPSAQPVKQEGQAA